MAPSTFHTPRFRALRVLLVVLAAAALLLAACGDDTGDESSSTTSDPETTTATDENIEVATTVCEAYGRVDEEGGIDDLLALLSEDVVLTDTVLGASLQGHEEVRGYLTSDAFDVDTSDCGVAVTAGNWVAGSYTLRNSETTAGGEGIAAIHVTDGLVDQQINHYTPVDEGAEAPSDELIADEQSLEYCEAWDDGADADEVLSFMATDAELTIGGATIGGEEAIEAYIDDDFDFDTNECQDVVVEHSGWIAGANRFTNTGTGASAEGVQVFAVDDEGLITDQFGHMDLSA